MSNVGKGGERREVLHRSASAQELSTSSTSRDVTQGSGGEKRANESKWGWRNLISWLVGQKPAGAELETVLSTTGLVEYLMDQSDDPYELGSVLRLLTKKTREGVAKSIGQGRSMVFEYSELGMLKEHLGKLPKTANGKTVIPDITVRVPFVNFNRGLVEQIKALPGDRAVKLSVEVNNFEELNALWSIEGAERGLHSFEEDSDAAEDTEEDITAVTMKNNRECVRRIFINPKCIREKGPHEVGLYILALDKALNGMMTYKENKISIEVGALFKKVPELRGGLGLFTFKKKGDDALYFEPICSYITEFELSSEPNALMTLLGETDAKAFNDLFQAFESVSPRFL